MAIERTLSIVKPNALKKNHIGEAITFLENGGLSVVAAKMMHLTKEKAEGFYAVHKERPFFNDLVEFMISAPVLVMVLEGENAIERNRKIMGATNPADAEKGTIRERLGEDIQNNAVHGSDAPETAKFEISYFFNNDEICPRN